MTNYTKTGAGPLLIYVPGLDGTGELFFRQVAGLSDHYSVVTYPFRQEPPFDYEDLMQDIIEIIDNEKRESAIIVAESFGGTVGLHFALHHGNRVNRLVLVNTFPYFRRRFLLGLGTMLLPLAFNPLIQFGRKLFLKPLMLGEQVDPDAIVKLFSFSLTHKPEAYRKRMRLIRELDLRERLSEISVPVTIVAAEKDKLVPSVREAQLMSEKIKDCKVVLLPGHGHACLLSSHFQLNSVLKVEP